MRFISQNMVYIYTSLWVLYLLQNLLLLRGPIAQLILATIFVISFYAFFQVNLYYKTSPYLKWLNVMLLILTIYGLIPILGGEVIHKNGNVDNVTYNYYYLQKIYRSVLPIYAFYYFAIKGQISARNTFLLFGAILICSILMFYQSFQISSEKFDKEEVTNNIGYVFVPLILMLYVLKVKIIWKYLLLSVIFFYIMMSIKRGAILAGSLALLSFMTFQLKTVTKKQVVYILALSAIALVAVIRFITNLYETSPYFRVRLERTLRGDSSGRDLMYSHYMDYFISKTTPMEFLFGHGAAGTIKIFGQWAHNDWLEFAINQGVLGMMLYLIYWMVFVCAWKNYHGPEEYKRALRDCILVYSLIAIFSMSFSGMPLAATLCIGYCLAYNESALSLQENEY